MDEACEYIEGAHEQYAEKALVLLHVESKLIHGDEHSPRKDVKDVQNVKFEFAEIGPLGQHLVSGNA
jgi:hypothetical protein